MIEKKNQLKKKSSLKNILKEDINTYTKNLKKNKKQMNKFCDKLIKQMQQDYICN